MTKSTTHLDSRGFSIVELLVTALVTSILLTGFVSMASFQVSTTRDQTSQLDLQQSVRDITEMFAREVRRTGSDPTCAGGFEPVFYASEQKIRLKSDLNGNGAIDSTGDEDVIYQFYNGDLLRIANGVIEVLLDDVNLTDSKIMYFDAADSRLIPAISYYGLNEARRGLVRRVELTLDIEKVTSSGERLRARATSDISLRNRFFVSEPSC